MERDLFLRKYRIEQEDFDAAGVSWEELTAIADHYATIEGKLREIGKDFVDKYLYDIEKAGIHSYRYRTKAPGHLLEKIIRKKKEQPDKFAQLGVDNYWKYVTDLIGIRVFFLYREDWRHFHEYITSAFENAPEQYVKDRERDFDNDETHCYIAERPKVYRRNGDSRIYDENVIETSQAVSTVPFTTSSNTAVTTSRFRRERCSRRGGVRLTTTLFIRTTRTT